MRNPVMFVVEVGSILTTTLLILDTIHGHGNPKFDLQITLWLWFTVLFANFAEAMAEGRGKAQADALRQANRRQRLIVLRSGGMIEEVPSSSFRAQDLVRVSAGQIFRATVR